MQAKDKAAEVKYSDAEVQDLITANAILDSVVTELKAQLATAHDTIASLQSEQSERALEASPTGRRVVMPFLYKGVRIETKDLTTELVTELDSIPMYKALLV